MLDWVLGRHMRAETRSGPVLVATGLLLAAVRVLLAQPFWASGQTRWVEFPTQIAGSTLYLFANEFVLHFGFFDLPIPFPVLTAWVTSLAEIVLPILLVVGLMTRLAALALLAMSVVIQLVFPQGLVNMIDPMNSHALWMAYALVLVWFGPGVLSLDAGLRCLRRRSE